MVTLLSIYLYNFIIFVRYLVIVIGLEANSIGPLQCYGCRNNTCVIIVLERVK